MKVAADRSDVVVCDRWEPSKGEERKHGGEAPTRNG